MDSLTTKIKEMLAAAGVEPKDHEKLAQPLVEYARSLKDMSGVVSLEIGFRPVPADYPRDFGDFPQLGVLHLVTVVESKDFSKEADRETWWKLIKQEDVILDQHKRVPVEFNIGPLDRFHTRTGPYIFEKMAPEGTKHLLTITKGDWDV